MEKVINEIKVMEIEDGFRIEIKGDKEAIRQMLRNCGCQPFSFDFSPNFWSQVGKWRGFWQDTPDEKKTEPRQ